MKNVWTCNFLCVHNKLKLFDMISTWHSIMKVAMVPDCETAVVFGNFCPSRSIPALSRTGICHIEALAELQEFIGFRCQFVFLGWGPGVNFSINLFLSLIIVMTTVVTFARHALSVLIYLSFGYMTLLMVFNSDDFGSCQWEGMGIKRRDRVITVNGCQGSQRPNIQRRPYMPIYGNVIPSLATT